jgi:hypothetical protein
MARISSFPTTFDERKFISIADLRKWGYLVAGNYKSSTIRWSRNDDPRGSIGIAVSMDKDVPYITLSYVLNKEKDIKYNVSLVSAASNLGKGRVWYFRCPYTKKLCRKLFLIDGYFMHREAIKGYYFKQIQSKEYRYLEKVYGPMFQEDKLYDQLYSKHFRKFYKGKPTKRYLKIMKQLQASKGVDRAAYMDALVNGR